jgi:glycosyltransferase involved in cell wall biosynthesis
MRISIAIPTHEMGGKGPEFLVRSLNALREQTFKDFEVVITDNSLDDNIRQVLQLGNPYEPSKWGFPISYSKNPRKGMAPNTNEAIKNCTGDIIKILYLDDCLAHPNALRLIDEAFTPEVKWVITACSTNDNPHYTGDIHQGNNKLGSPSVLAFRNSMSPLYFDENMTWLLDCDLYKRMYKEYGEPKILRDINVNIGIGDHQMTNILTPTEKKSEEDYMFKKYL